MAPRRIGTSAHPSRRRRWSSERAIPTQGPTTPQTFGEIDFGEYSPSVIEQSLMRDPDRSTEKCVDEAQRLESPDAVGREVEARPRRRPRRGTLDDFGSEPLLSKRSPEREAADAATDNENAQGRHTL